MNLVRISTFTLTLFEETAALRQKKQQCIYIQFDHVEVDHFNYV